MAKNFAKIIAAGMVFVLLSVSCAPVTGPGYVSEDPVTEQETLESLRSRIRYIIHGGGKLEGHNLYGERKYFTCSNSMEGFRQCIDSGCEFIETDFSFTSDGELVCIHDWYPSYSDDIGFEGDVLPLEKFLSTRIFRQYTPVSADMLADLLRSNKGIYIITDIKDNNLAGLGYIAEKYPDLRNRFIAQIYSESEYDPVRELGFEYIIYTLYRLDWNAKVDTAEHCRFASENPLAGITFSYELCEIPGFVEEMKSSEAPLFVHTVNDTEDQMRYFEMGIQGVYTDEIAPK